MDNWELISPLLGLWKSGNLGIAALATLFFTLHAVAYTYEENYRTWFVGLGLPGAVMHAITAILPKIGDALKKLWNWVKKGFDFVKDFKEKIKEFIAKHTPEQIKRAVYYLRSATDDEKAHRARAEAEKKNTQHFSWSFTRADGLFNVRPDLRAMLTVYGPKIKAIYLTKQGHLESDHIQFLKVEPDGALTETPGWLFPARELPPEFASELKRRVSMWLEFSFNQNPYSIWDDQLISRDATLTTTQKQLLLQDWLMWKVSAVAGTYGRKVDGCVLTAYGAHSQKRYPAYDIPLLLSLSDKRTLSGLVVTLGTAMHNEPRYHDPRFIRFTNASLHYTLIERATFAKWTSSQRIPFEGAFRVKCDDEKRKLLLFQGNSVKTYSYDNVNVSGFKRISAIPVLIV